MGRLISTGIGVLVLSIGSLLAAWPQQPERLATPIAQGKPADTPRQPIEERPAFEAATVKLAAPDAAPNSVRPTGPNRLSIPSMTLSWLIYTAYGDGGFNTAMRVTGGPDWINRTTFAVEGVASGRPTLRQFRLMLQRLLEERFALKMRTEMSTGDMLTLVTERSDGTLGPKVKPWSGTCPKVMPLLYFQAPRRALLQDTPRSEAGDAGVAECPSGYRAGGIALDGVTMFTVAEVLSLPPGRALLGTMLDNLNPSQRARHDEAIHWRDKHIARRVD